jgi:hypothetical protein
MAVVPQEFMVPRKYIVGKFDEYPEIIVYAALATELLL